MLSLSYFYLLEFLGSFDQVIKTTIKCISQLYCSRQFHIFYPMIQDCFDRIFG